MGSANPKWGFVNLKMQLRSSGELSFKSYCSTVKRTCTLDPAVRLTREGGTKQEESERGGSDHAFGRGLLGGEC